MIVIAAIAAAVVHHRRRTTSLLDDEVTEPCAPCTAFNCNHNLAPQTLLQKAAAYKAASDIEAANLHDTVAEAILASGCLGGSGGSSGEEGSRTTLGGKKAPKLPDEELQLIAATLASEINDKQLVILDVLGRGGFGTVRGRL